MAAIQSATPSKYGHPHQRTVPYSGVSSIPERITQQDLTSRSHSPDPQTTELENESLLQQASRRNTLFPKESQLQLSARGTTYKQVSLK